MPTEKSTKAGTTRGGVRFTPDNPPKPDPKALPKPKKRSKKTVSNRNTPNSST